MIRDELLNPFPIRVSVRYRSLSKARGVAGFGRSLKLSSNILLIRSEYPAKPELMIGVRLEVSLDWPHLPNGLGALEMLLIGTVLRYRNSTVALSIERCHFRVARKQKPASFVHLDKERRAAERSSASFMLGRAERMD
jgi:hypothetical protein